MSGLVLTTILWLALLAAILFIPSLTDSSTLGDDLIRNTIRLALLYYAIAATLLLWSRPKDWECSSKVIRLARTCWIIAWLTYITHVAMAFHFAHHWSHAEAMRHTEEVSGFGPGIFVSHLFTIVWTADVASWWLAPGWYARRPVWIDWTIHAFMVFVIFNGTVVFVSGPIRWAGVVMFGWLAAVALCRWYGNETAGGFEK